MSNDDNKNSLVLSTSSQPSCLQQLIALILFKHWALTWTTTRTWVKLFMIMWVNRSSRFGKWVEIMRTSLLLHCKAIVSITLRLTGMMANLIKLLVLIKLKPHMNIKQLAVILYNWMVLWMVLDSAKWNEYERNNWCETRISKANDRWYLAMGLSGSEF